MPDRKLTELNNYLDKIVEELPTERDHKKYLKLFAGALRDAAQHILEVGDAASAQVLVFESEKNTSAESVLSFFLAFKWAPRAKALLVLWRDMLFEQEKAQVLLRNGKTDEESLHTLRERCETTLHQAIQDLRKYLQNQTEAHGQTDKAKKFLAPLFLQTNPWGTYKLQIQTLAEQTEVLQERMRALLFTTDTFEKIDGLIRKTVIDCQAEIGEALLSLDTVIAYVNDNAAENPGKIITYLESEEAKIQNHDHGSQFTAELYELIDKLPADTDVPVAVSGGPVEVREVNFKKSARAWLDSEILPQLYEVWELTEGIRTGLKMSLLNVRNRAVLLNTEQAEKAGLTESLDSITKPLLLFKETSARLKAECTDIYTTIDTRLRSEFETAAVYRTDKEFLNIPLQSAINQIVFSQGAFLTRVKDWFVKQINRVRRIRTDVRREDALSISEKVVRYLEERAPDVKNSQYASIFLTKGYIGESFRVGREEEIARMEKLIRQWNNGYRGSVLLTGKRFSGRTLFGDLTADRFFHGNSIALQPNTEIDFNGRRFQTSYSLREALDWVEKHTINSRSMLWLDNLELWSNADNPVSENVRALQKFIDSNAGRIFIVVSVSNWLQDYLNRTHDLNKYFQAEINMDKMPRADIARAIAIRHGATHRKLINEEGEEISSSDFAKFTNTVYRQTEGNIGEALLRWSNSIEPAGENEVRRHKKTEAELPEFITSDTGIVLSAIMLRKRTNEYNLLKAFGSPFKNKYAAIVQRLLSLGLLHRHLDGSLEVKETAVNDIGRQLDRQNRIKFYR